MNLKQLRRDLILNQNLINDNNEISNLFDHVLSNNKYDIIINSETNNQISKKFFYKKKTFKK